MAEHWPKLRFGSITVETEAGQHCFQVQAYLNELDHHAVRVELFAQPHNGGEPARQPMTRGHALIGSENAYCYTARVDADRPTDDFTPRIIPFHPGASVPL
jgi:starch phosphorylase